MTDTLVDVVAAELHQAICCTIWEVQGDRFNGTYLPDAHLTPDPGHAHIDRIRATQLLQGLARRGYEATSVTAPDGTLTREPLLTPREPHGPCIPGCVLTAPHMPPCQACLCPPCTSWAKSRD